MGPDNPVSFIQAFVDGLNLKDADFLRVDAKDTGRPGFDTAVMLRLYIYGYLNRVRFSRWLEAETHRNIEAIWLLRHLKPDFRTIAAFRRINRSAFRKVFREFVILCRQLDLYGRALLADRSLARSPKGPLASQARHPGIQAPLPQPDGTASLFGQTISHACLGTVRRRKTPNTARDVLNGHWTLRNPPLAATLVRKDMAGASSCARWHSLSS